MGTHVRLGEGYASRDEPCAVRLVANSEDLLRLVASFVRGTTRPILRPPSRETVVLRAKYREIEADRHHYRHVAEISNLLAEEDRLRAELDALQAQLAASRIELEGERAAHAKFQVSAALHHSSMHASRAADG